MENTMNTRASANNPLDVIALGWGLSAALVVLFVICLAVAVVCPIGGPRTGELACFLSRR